jgi:23S rRNA pseudouridine2605 synthase
MPEAEGERLQKVLARVGHRQPPPAEELIARGRSSSTASPRNWAGASTPATDRVELDGTPIPVAPDLVHLCSTSPEGVRDHRR